MHINPMTIHFGLENIYVSIKNKPIVSTKKQKDIENYNKIKELTTKYAKTIDTTKINETEFQKKITNYISTKQEINNLKDEKKEKISSLIYTFIKMDNDFKFKQEEITLGGYKITEINKAIDKIRYI
jgi:predicted flavoprotein YhiN